MSLPCSFDHYEVLSRAGMLYAILLRLVVNKPDLIRVDCLTMTWLMRYLSNNV